MTTGQGLSFSGKPRERIAPSCMYWTKLFPGQRPAGDPILGLPLAACDASDPAGPVARPQGQELRIKDPTLAFR